MNSNTMHTALVSLVSSIAYNEMFDWSSADDSDPLMKVYDLFDPQREKNLINVLPEIAVVTLAFIRDEGAYYDTLRASLHDRATKWFAECFENGLCWELAQIATGDLDPEVIAAQIEQIGPHGFAP